MPQSAKVNILEVDKSFFVESQIQGVVGVQLKTKRGQYLVADEIITNWSRFIRLYGDEDPSYPGVTLAKRALQRGAKLRVNKVGHHTTISDPTSIDAVKAVIDESGPDFAIVTGAVDAFDIAPKHKGADYNNLQAKITAASNGDSAYFNLEINHLVDTYLNEKYENLTIPGIPTVAQSHYLDNVISQSLLIDVTYKDLSGQTGPLRPANGTWVFSGGTNGSAIVDADYVGDSGGTGVYAFSKYDDFEAFAALDNESTTYHNGAATYAAARQDCVALLHISNSNDSHTEVATARTSTTVDTRYAAFFCGGLVIANPFTGSETPTPMNISELGDVIGALAKSSAEFGPWYSFAGLQRGVITEAFGVVNNFAPGGPSRLDELAMKQVNAVVQINGQIFIKGNFSAQKATSRKSFLNVVKLLIYIKKSLRPTLERYLEQPNDFRTWREVYNEVQPFLNSLVGNDKRALVDYDWRGDQFANTDADLKINNRNDIDQGKYKVELWLKEVVSLQEFTLTIISAPSSVSFEDTQN